MDIQYACKHDHKLAKSKRNNIKEIVLKEKKYEQNVIFFEKSLVV